MTGTIQRTREILSCVQYKDWTLCVGLDSKLDFSPYLEWRASVRCVHTGKVVTLTSRKRYLWDGITESELVRLAFDTALAMESHEAHENFRYCGQRVFNPHINVRRLLEICDDENARAGA